MNLYDALFIKRPVVEPELFASLRPVTYSGGLGLELPKLAEAAPQADFAPAAKDAKGKSENRRMDEKESLARQYRGAFAREVRKSLAQDLDLGKSVNSAATASNLGDYFQYAIDHAVNLPRQKSALLPIVGKDVDGERVSIYNERTHAKFPLLGLTFKNTTGM